MSDHAMTIGLDLGDRHSHVFLLMETGEEERARITTTPTGISRFFGRVSPARVVLEVGTHSRWVSKQLGELGHQVVIANPRRVRLISQNAGKSDQEDPELLARLGRADVKLLAPIEHRSDESHRVLSLVRVRDGLVRARAQLINQCRGTVKAWGERLPSCSTANFHRVRVPEKLIVLMTPLMGAIAGLTEQIRSCERMMQRMSGEMSDTQLLREIPGVGPVLSLTFVAMVERPEKFRSNRSVGAYLGLCPRRSQSGDGDPELPISKCGDGYLRRLLVTSAHCILGPRGRDSDLRRWGLAQASKGGKNAKKRAIIGVARKLAVLMLSVWKSRQPYRPLRDAA
jgi:transposase